MRESDTVARLGGDEFAVLAHDLDGPEDALAVAERVRSALADPVTVADILLDVDASIGVALAPEHGTDVRLLHQPQAGTASGELRGVEALVRWPHPTRGLLGPEQFIPLAERTGLIRSLTRLVLEHAIRQCRAWHDQGFKLAVSVNITGRDLLDMKLPDEVAGLLTEARLDPRFLELEITENTILADPIRARAILTRLSDLGVRLAIDDFGSGNSSLGYLKRLPVDVLKIDKSFVLNMESDEDDETIVRSTIALSHNLGLAVVAEGVETKEAWNKLALLGCDIVQGYYLSRPVPPRHSSSTGASRRGAPPPYDGAPRGFGQGCVTGQRKSASPDRVTVTSPAACAAATASSEVSR